MSDIILVAGFNGTPIRHLAHLINHHEGFHTGEKTDGYNHVAWSHVDETWIEYKENIGASLVGENPEHKAIVANPFPSLYGRERMTPDMFGDMIEQGPINKICIVHFNPEDTQLWNKVGNENIDASEEFNLGAFEELTQRDSEEDHFELDIVIIDGSAILEKSEEQYEKMVSLLGMTPLDGWKAVVDEIVADFYA